MDFNRSYDSVWDFDQNRRFRVPEKSIEEIRRHFLEEDVEAIGSSRIPLPESECSSANSMSGQMQIGSSQVGREVRRRKTKPLAEEDVGREDRQIKARPWSVEEVGREDQRRRAKPWSEEEHRLFLLGLQRLGRGDWKGISRNFVLSKTPVQVASHAQKYFERLKTSDKKRPSIHDITTTGEACGSTPQEPITGMKPRGSCSGRTWKEHPQPPMGPGPDQFYNSGPPCLPPPPANSSTPGEGVYYGVNALTPGLLFPDDMVGLASVDILYPGLRGRMF